MLHCQATEDQNYSKSLIIKTSNTAILTIPASIKYSNPQLLEVFNSPKPFTLTKPFPKSFPNLTPRLSLAQLGSAWLNLAQLGSAFLCFCFTLFLSGIVSPNLASFSPKPFGHVRIIAVIRLFPFRHSFTIQILIDFLFTNLSDNQLYSSLFKYH